MKYEWNDNVITLQRYDKFVFVNPEKNSWLKANVKVKEIIDNFIKCNDMHQVSEAEENSILKKFLKLGILETNKKEQTNFDNNYISSMYFTLTRKCNLKCNFCGLDCSPDVKETRIVNTAEIKSIIDELRNYKVGSIIITGGEPVLRSDLLEIINYINDNIKCKIILETNGLLIDSQLIKKIKGKLLHLDISFENIFEKGAEWQKEKIIEVVEKLKKYDIPMLFSYVVTSENWKNVFRFIDLVAKYNPKDIIIRNVASVGKCRYNEELLLDSCNILKIYKQICEYIYINKYDLPCIERFMRMELLPRKSCSAKGDMLFMYPDGNIYSCPSLCKSEFSFGNILNGGLSEILKNRYEKRKSEFYEKCFNIDRKNSECQECEIKYFCGGTCFAEVYENQDVIEKIPIDCELKKITINYNLWEYDSKQDFLSNLKKLIEKLDEKIS